MRRNRTALILMAAILAMVTVAPLLSDNAEAAPSATDVAGVTFSLSPNSQGTSDIYAGKSIDIYVHMTNETVSLLGTGGIRYVEFVGDSFEEKGHIDTPDHGGGPIMLGFGPDDKSYTLHLVMTADRYLGSMNGVVIELNFVAYDPADTVTPAERCTLTKTIDIHSGRASENQFNKVMGMFHNPLPPPFDTALYAAALTLLIWLAISLAVTYILLPNVIMPFLIRDSKNERDALKKKIQKPMFFMLLLYGITVCFAVLGAGEYVVSTVEMVAWIIYIVFGAWIFLKLLAAALDMRDRRNAEDMDQDMPDDSLTPLLLMLGKIIIGMVAVGAMLSVLGFDMMIIATGAGVIGLAISFGAQSTLAQFFSGFTLLVNRPFRPGDMIRLDDGTDTLKVLNVGFMMTTFRNWANSEIFTMPNQKVVSSTIVNITAESLSYRIIILVRVPYGTDVTLAKKLALEAMTEHPRILQDGSEEIPKVRFEDFSESSVTIRVSGFVDDFDDHRTIAGEIRDGIYAKYLDNNVTIAIPKMDVYVRKPSGEESELDL